MGATQTPLQPTIVPWLQPGKRFQVLTPQTEQRSIALALAGTLPQMWEPAEVIQEHLSLNILDRFLSTIVEEKSLLLRCRRVSNEEGSFIVDDR
jgi:hypothetical protein